MAGERDQTLDIGPLTGGTRLVDVIAQKIKEAIVGGRLRPGTQLSVPALARSLTVSRSPVREAILHLVGQGLAVETPRKGVVVARVDHDDLMRIHEIREYLEAAAARYCAERAPASLIDRLEAIIGDQERAVRQGLAQGYFETNASLHRTIARGAASPRLSTILDQLEAQMSIALQHISTSREHMAAGLREHAGIVAPIRRRDAPAAEAAMRAHIAATLARVRLQRG
ncbi:MAG: GntR family transcriptional regulator [Hyphomicrobiaceae bacterium]|nr:GntR family transcriptional regulator [Hyphomicrobiaceae bacterium]